MTPPALPWLVMREQFHDPPALLGFAQATGKEGPRNRQAKARRWLAPVATTLGAWLLAFLVVTALLTLLGDELGALPLALRALLISGVLVALMVNLVMPALSAAVARWAAASPRSRPAGIDRAPSPGTRAMPEHPQLEALPEWPTRTIAVLSTADPDPYAIPVSAPLRAGNRRILLSLHRSRGSLARLRNRPRVALTVLTEGDIACTARGHARIVEEPLARVPDHAAVAIEVEHIDDHRQAEFAVESGIDRLWLDEDEQRALRERFEALSELAAGVA
jgi:Pyridoxamine 5'-phosphate oxidase